jgi:hypothetical protein
MPLQLDDPLQERWKNEVALICQRDRGRILRISRDRERRNLINGALAPIHGYSTLAQIPHTVIALPIEPKFCNLKMYQRWLPPYGSLGIIPQYEETCGFSYPNIPHIRKQKILESSILNPQLRGFLPEDTVIEFETYGIFKIGSSVLKPLGIKTF